MMATMKAAVIYEPGGPDVLKVETRPIPTPRGGEVLIRVKAFGLNRSELFTRQGHSPGVKFASSTVNRQHKEAGETRRARSKLIRARQCG
jgi:NADPH:quinone reductase-like Zn-dependent oxidoreductase